VCFLDDGVLLEQGSPADMFTTPRQARTREFLARVLPA
jgi:polar amino acid transport system ATP-binding protein